MKKIANADASFYLGLTLMLVFWALAISSLSKQNVDSSDVFYFAICASVLVTTLVLLGVFLQKKELKEKEESIQSLLNSERSLKESETALRDSTRKALEESRGKTMFLAMAGHELRTPLNGIIGLAELLRKSNLGEKETSYADNIYYSGKSLLKTLNNTLEFAKIESGNIELENAEFNIFTIIDQIISTLSVEAKEKNLNLTYIIEKDVPQKIFGDSSRLSQIIYNLVGNAIKFTAIGSVTLKVKVQKIDPANCLHLLISVQDTGVGLAPEQMQKIFLPFNILQSKDEKDIGAGLGLAISMQLAKAMGGEIHVTSEIGKGSIFSFEPIFSKYSQEKVGEIEQQVTNKNEHKEIAPVFSNENKPVILVVDDNPTNLLMAQAMLEKLGAKTLVATNGKEAIYENSHTKVDLILMDCEMPVMDGFMTTRELRKLHFDTPILAMTAHTSREDRENCINAGMNGFIAKPISINLLASELNKALSH